MNNDAVNLTGQAPEAHSKGAVWKILAIVFICLFVGASAAAVFFALNPIKDETSGNQESGADDDSSAEDDQSAANEGVITYT